jgi:hypothetical protein
VQKRRRPFIRTELHRESFHRRSWICRTKQRIRNIRRERRRLRDDLRLQTLVLLFCFAHLSPLSTDIFDTCAFPPRGAPPRPNNHEMLGG